MGSRAFEGAENLIFKDYEATVGISCICWSIASSKAASALSLGEYAYLSELMIVC